MSAKINSYNTLDDATISARIVRLSDAKHSRDPLLARVAFAVKGEISYQVIDDSHKVVAFCKKHNIPITPDARTGVDVYLDNLRMNHGRN